MQPRTAALDAMLRRDFPFLKDVVARTAAESGAAWADEMERTLRMFDDAELATAGHGYARFVVDLVRRQRAFERDGAYPRKSYSEAAAEVYHDDAYMTGQYLPGLLIAHLLWPHHRRHAEFFDAAFADVMATAGARAFAEVGVGTGFYSRRLLERLPEVRGAGYDVSAAALAFARRHLDALGVADRYETRLGEPSIDPVEWLVCIEVLEHLEDPVAFLRDLRAALVPGGTAFVTAALNAAHVDHIFLYESPDAVAAHLAEAGFAVQRDFVGAAHPPARPDQPVPAVAAFVVT